MLFERERHHLMQAARVLERQIEQALGDEIGRQRRDDDIGLTGLGDQARERAAEIAFVVGANLVVHAGEREGVPRALRDSRAHAVAD